MYWILSLRTKSNISMPLCTLTKFWHSQLMLVVHISAHKSWYFFVSVFSPEQKRKLPHCHGLYSAQQHRGGLLSFMTGLQFPFNHDVRVSLHGTCFIIGRSRLQNQITLRLVFFSWQLLASFIYSARILEEFHLIHRFLSPTIPSLHTLRDRE